ncbi:hypothetical protein B4U79_01791, partial [Dinothrombium tinctorium]
MQFEPIVTLNFWYFFKNFLNTVLVIQPFFDKEFTVHKFMEGAKQALVVISNHLANGNVDALKGLVSDEALEEIKRNLPYFTPSEREKLRTKMEDIKTAYAYQIGIIMNDDKRFVEITVVYWCDKMLEKQFFEMSMSGKTPNFKEFAELAKEDMSLCNYRFI